ncbi:hypothetical protein [Curtobacterium sp. MCSS17_016]|uniref:hypothetical protein n=1 Tax=Curtobacterium sp. MCSS17_016 TaxID=2175644 RepID=UPI000DAACC58|nr:hypothetical protein [Curtobacterium sp. MCSS17_016]WIE80990.1 hypothetical protein DEJ19_020955 [Curtobacterium sp. MCSS17_016]
MTLTTITFISSAAIKGQAPALHYQPITAADDDTFILTETELREIVQVTVAACYDISNDLGVVADFWAVALLHRTPHQPAPEDITAALNCTLDRVEELTLQVRDVARDVHEEETGLPAPW